jgi:hypothetical protein
MIGYRDIIKDIHATGTPVLHEGEVVANKKIGLQLRWDTEGTNKIPIMFPSDKFDVALNWLLFYLKGYNNVNYLPEYIRDAGFSHISDEDINTFIEKQLWQSGKQKPTDIPADILRGIKSRLVNDQILGYMGRTPGEIIRNIKNNSFNMFTPVTDFNVIASDIQDEVKKEYERLKEEDEAIKSNNISFEKAYPHLGLKYVDQYQTLLNQIKFGVYFPLYLTHHIPIYMPIPGLTCLDNMWINRFSEVPEIAYQQFICDDETLSLVITQPVMRPSSDVISLTTSVLLLLLTAKITNRTAGQVIWNYGEGVVQDIDLSYVNSVIGHCGNKNHRVEFSKRENFLDYVVEDFELTEIE